MYRGLGTCREGWKIYAALSHVLTWSILLPLLGVGEGGGGGGSFETEATSHHPHPMYPVQPTYVLYFYPLQGPATGAHTPNMIHLLQYMQYPATLCVAFGEKATKSNYYNLALVWRALNLAFENKCQILPKIPPVNNCNTFF